jgi:hypothetical protein
MVAAALLPEKGAMTTQAQEAKTPTGRQAPSVKSEAFNSPMPVCVKGLEPGTGGTTAAPALMRRGNLSDGHQGICDRISKLASMPNYECAGVQYAGIHS